MAMPERDDRVERVERSNYPPVSAEKATGGIRQLLIMAVVSVASTMVLLMFWAMPQMVSKTDFTKNIQAMSTDVASAKTLAASISAQIAAVSDSVKQVSVEVSAIKNSAYMTSTAVNSLIANQINPIQQNLTSLTTAVGRLPTSMPDINPLKTQITDLQKELDAIEVDITTLKSVTIPVSGLPTISSFSPTSGTTGTSVVITGTNFNGATAVLFGGSSATYTINSATQITAIMGAGMNGSVSVTTPAGTVTATGVFTNTGTTTPTVGTVTTVYPTTSVILVKQADNVSYANNFNLTINNGLAKDIFSGQIGLTVQYIGGITPLVDGAGTLTAAGVFWQAPSVGQMSFSIVSDPTLYITANSATTLTVNFKIIPITTPTTTQYIRITAASYTGYSQ